MATFVCRCYRIAGPTSSLGPWISNRVRCWWRRRVRCDRAHAWRVDDREPPAGGQVAHFLVPVARMWDDVVYTCGNQRIFCSEDCVAIWLNESGHQRGSVLDLQTLWRLAAGWAVSSVDMSAVSRALPTAGSVGVPVIRPGQLPPTGNVWRSQPGRTYQICFWCGVIAPNPRHRPN